jgi:hypothetical protein
VTSRIPTLPSTEPLMWRKLLARVHPDSGGGHELYIWATAVEQSLRQQMALRRLGGDWQG